MKKIQKTTFSRSFFISLFISGFLLLFSMQCSTMRGIFSKEKPQQPAFEPVMPGETIKLGIDVLIEQQLDMVKGKRVGLITNPSGVNRFMESTIDVLFRHPDINLTALFAPEHGIRGKVPTGQPFEHYTDTVTGLPVYSLYGSTKKPTPEMLANVDVLLFDIQDVGVRPYTYIYTMAYAMEAAKEAGIEFYVLDRPNPLNGELVEGNVLHPDFKSFIGLYPIPYVHGMTAGELAWLFNREFGIGVNLRTVPMEGWSRGMTFKDTGLEWIPTSPHIPNAETAAYYATTGSIGELGTISVGVGYTLPFRIVGAPWIDANELAAELNSRNLPGVTFRPMYWKQFYGIYEDQSVGGVELHINDLSVYRPFATGIHILEAIRTLYPDREIFPDNRASNFKFATGTDTILTRLKAGVPADVIIKSYQHDLEAFKILRQEYLLY